MEKQVKASPLDLFFTFISNPHLGFDHKYFPTHLIRTRTCVWAHKLMYKINIVLKFCGQNAFLEIGQMKCTAR